MVALFTRAAHFLVRLSLVSRNFPNSIELVSKLLQKIALIVFELSKPCLDSTNLALLCLDGLNAGHIELYLTFLFLFAYIILLLSASGIFHKLFSYICFMITTCIVG